MLISSAWYEGNTTYDRTKRSINVENFFGCIAETSDLNDGDEDHSLTTVGHRRGPLKFHWSCWHRIGPYVMFALKGAVSRCAIFIYPNDIPYGSGCGHSQC